MYSYYLIAYIARNDRILSEKIYTNNQAEAIKQFKENNPCCEIIAVSFIEG